ncbi:MAG: glycosyltransferase family 39 protein [Patescibacteria group bacterium]|nr:glycosyltransferase family 39 protein [Patescibacteria group bacterium]
MMQRVSLVILLLLHLSICYKLFFISPSVWPDESYFLVSAERLLHDGILSMPLYGTEGIGSPDIRMYSYPPLYFYILAIWIKLFGSSLEAVRFLSLLISCIAIVFFYLLIQRIARSSLAAFMGTLALILFQPFGMAARIGRMEIFIFLTIILGLYTTSPLISGFLSGIAILLHPIGCISCLASTLFFKSKRIFFFLLPIALCGIFWIFSVSDRFDLFLTQMNLQFSYKSGREPLINLLFQNNLFWRAILLLYLFLGSLGIACGIQQRDFYKTFLGFSSYATIIILFYAVDQWYLVFLPVFPILLAAYQKQSLIIIALALLHGYNSISGLVEHIQKNEHYHEFVKTISTHIPHGKTVVLSAIPDPYFELRKRSDLTLYHVPHVTDQGKLQHMLDRADILIYNYTTNKDLEAYLENHDEKKTFVIQTHGYYAEVLFLSR